MSEEWEKIGEIIKNKREKKSLSEWRLSQDIGLSSYVITKYESGDLSGLEIYVKEHLKRISDKLDLNYVELLDLYEKGMPIVAKPFSDNIEILGKKERPYYLYVALFLSIVTLLVSFFKFLDYKNRPICVFKGNGRGNEKIYDTGTYKFKGPGELVFIDGKKYVVNLENFEVKIWEK